MIGAHVQWHTIWFGAIILKGILSTRDVRNFEIWYFIIVSWVDYSSWLNALLEKRHSPTVNFSKLFAHSCLDWIMKSPQKTFPSVNQSAWQFV